MESPYFQILIWFQCKGGGNDMSCYRGNGKFWVGQGTGSLQEIPKKTEIQCLFNVIAMPVSLVIGTVGVNQCQSDLDFIRPGGGGVYIGYCIWGNWIALYNN